MSEVYGVRSYGDPYFAAVQADLTLMDRGNAPRSISPGGEVGIQLDLTVEKLPIKLATDDEAHILFSYHEVGAGAIERVWFGLTPSGRLIGGWKGIIGNAFSMSTGAGLVLPDARIHRANFVTVEDGTGEIRWDGAQAALVPSDVSRTWDEIGPADGYLGRFSLFSGMAGTTRCACTIRNAQIAFDEGVVRWPIEERFGVDLDGVSDVFPDQDFELVIQRYNPTPLPLVWGSIPELPVSTAYRWYRKTLWTRQTRTKTIWSRAA